MSIRFDIKFSPIIDIYCQSCPEPFSWPILALPVSGETLSMKLSCPNCQSLFHLSITEKGNAQLAEELELKFREIDEKSLQASNRILENYDFQIDS